MPQIQIIAPTAQQQTERLRVAAYARVSSDSKDQLNSYASQIRYYTNYITAHENWDFVDIYADEGITGTRADKRDDFQRMMKDCRAHKIDTILVKSVSRFARNTQDCIEAVRELRSLGVTVIFEKEHLNTSSMANEMLLSMMSAFSQEESVSISKNMHKGATMRMQNGTFKVSQPPYGYRYDENRCLVIHSEEANVIRFIYTCYLSGDGINIIQRRLKKLSLGCMEREFLCSKHGILYILTNERYMGDELFQKCYHTQMLPRKQLPNRGNLPQFYATGTHEAIIEPEMFQRVQELLKDKREIFGKTPANSPSPLRGLLHCVYCKKPLYRRVTARGIEWACYCHLQDASSCPLNNISEEQVSQILRYLYGKLAYNENEILNQYLCNLKIIADIQMNNHQETLAQNQKLSALLEQNYTLNRLRTKGCIDSAYFISQTRMIQQQITQIKTRLAERRNGTECGFMIESTQAIMNAVSDNTQRYREMAIIPHVVKIAFSLDQCKITLVNGMEFESKIMEKI